MSSARPGAVLPIMPGSTASARASDTRPLCAPNAPEQAAILAWRRRCFAQSATTPRERIRTWRVDAELYASAGANEESNQALERKTIQLAALQVENPRALHADERGGVV